jgi:hypothetical protein
MTKSHRLTQYVRMIEDFLARRSTAEEFSGAFFRAFHEDPGGWGGELYEALNWIATACESYTPRASKSEFDVTADQLRAQCSERLKLLRRLQRDLPGGQ